MLFVIARALPFRPKQSPHGVEDCFVVALKAPLLAMTI